MCGIAGLVNQKPLSNLTELVKMTDIINHRGPDDEGYVLFDASLKKAECYAGNNTPGSDIAEILPYHPEDHIDKVVAQKFDLGFGHRRLSILDLSPWGHQPMCDSSANYWITYNGEIFNYLELKAELENQGHTFRTHTDTEVILAAYKQWGLGCQEKFNGMWAFAIFNKQDQTLFLSRDRFGIKPLYYWFSPDNSFFWGSEIKQFTVLKGWSAELNYPRAFDYLMYSLTDHTDETMFKGVYHLPPGCCVHTSLNNFKAFESGKIASDRWYNPVYKGYKGSFADAKTEFRDHFKSAVELHLRSDVTVGSALSGGLDSSAIVSYVNILLREKNKEDLQKTFSSCSTDKRFDEKIWMDKVINHTKVDAHFVYPDGEQVFNLSEKIIWHQDEPYQSQSPFLSYHVFEKAKKEGVSVLLNGQGADEYLSGYSAFSTLRYRKLLKQFNWSKLSNEFGNKSFFSKILAGIKLLYYDLPASFINILTSFSADQKKKKSLFSSKLLSSSKVHPLRLIPYKQDSAFEIAHHQLLYQPLQKYLRWEDRNSMAHSVEARVPFLDYRLVEFTTQLPLDYLDAKNDSKRILTHGLEEILPEAIRNRKDKVGYISPEQRWFLEDFKLEFMNLFEDNIEYASDIINPDQARQYLQNVQSGKIPFDYTYWRIISFCIWMKIFKVKV